ncbi:hypothetical protein SCLCIDRAFT_25556 [Scleroderma citrinum Foug A]|uniref:Uncharacterized protein n=1 Tax=Scleroderma citrinum Foug A TaxID=1036808 RepID=A0A0C3DM59_9AGAM|nr:hypothetical protein SCLCIDRAFT_25556 [Scleroderma citrinum Foug A]
MSAPLKTNTPAPSTGKRDWARATMDELKSGSDDEPEIYNVKVGEHKQRQQAKKEAKEKEAREHQQREEVEHRAREEAARLEREAASVWRQEEADRRVQKERQAKEEKERLEREAAMCQEVAIKKAMETAEKRAQEDTEEKHAEALKKIWAAKETARQQVEAEASRQKSVAMKKWAREENAVAGPSGMPGPRLQTGAECKWDPENKRQRTCMQCARHKEKCEWPEVVGSVSGSGSGDMKGKGKAVATSPRAGEKKKHVKKLAAKVVDSDVEIVVKPSNVSGSGSSHALLQHMDRLILTVENLAEAQWYMASACAASGMVVGTLIDECNFLGFEGVGPGEEDEEEETDTEAVDQEAVEQEVAELRKEILEPWPSDNEM